MEGRMPVGKLTAPLLGDIYPCERLYASLDAALDQPVTWVVGAPGAGKTTLVAGWLQARKQRALWYQLDASDSDPATFFHYLNIAVSQLKHRKRVQLPRLAPEHLPNLSAFTRRFFESLGASLSPHVSLVLDNYHDVAPDSPLHALLSEALPMLPQHINVVTISRADPPPAFARLRVNRRITLVGADALALSADECIKLARHLGYRVPDEVVIRLHGKTAGWAAGLVLLLERACNAPASVCLSDAGDHSAGTQLLFDYFAGEILADSAPEVRDVLLKTAFLSRASVTAAQSVTGIVRAGDILQDFAQRHYFTARYPGSTEDSYEYHPLFRAFLLSQARARYSVTEFDATRRAAARLLEAQGDIESAVRLNLDLRDWDRSAELMLTHAPKLLEQGRHGTLREWIAALPAERVDVDPRMKYLLAAATQPTDLVAARNYYNDAFEAFKQRGDAHGAYSAWGGAVETFMYR